MSTGDQVIGDASESDTDSQRPLAEHRSSHLDNESCNLKESDVDRSDGNASLWLFDPNSFVVRTCHRSGPIAFYWLLTALFTSIFVSRHITKEGEDAFSPCVDFIAGIVLMIAGCVVVMVFYVCSEQTVWKLEQDHDDYDDNYESVAPAAHMSLRNKAFATIRENLVLIGLVPFYFVQSLLDFIRIVAELQCLPIWQLCPDVDVAHSRMLMIAFRCLRLLFMGLTMLLCVFFHRSVFRYCAFVLYGLAVLGAANTALWLETWLTEVLDNSLISGNSTDTDTDLGRIGQCLFKSITKPNETVATYSVEALESCTKTYNYLREHGHYFYPFSIEFSLLAVHCLVHWFVETCQAATTIVLCSNNTGTPEPTPVTAARQIQINDGVSHASLAAYTDPNSNYGTFSTAMPRPASVVSFGQRSRRTYTGETYADGLVGAYQTGTVRIYRIAVLLRTVFVLAVILANIVFCLLAIMSDYTSEKARSYFQVLYYAGLNVVLVVGFISGSKFIRECQELNERASRAKDRHGGLDYLVFFSSAGVFINSCFSIIAFVRIREPPKAGRAVCVLNEIFNMLQALLQTAFMSFVKGVDIGHRAGVNNYSQVDAESGYEREDEGQSAIDDRSVRSQTNAAVEWHRSLFMSVLLILVVSNISIWIVDSFVETSTVTNKLQLQYKYFSSSWIVIFNMQTPISIFFRFNSAVLILNDFFIQYGKL